MIEQLGGRKFIFAILALVLSFVLVFQRLITPQDWLGFVAIIGGTYVVGNVASKIADDTKE